MPLKKNFAINLVTITQLKTMAYKQEELWNKTSLNYATYLYCCNLNCVSIVATLMKPSLSFENLTLHFVSYCILISFISAWWPYIIFYELQSIWQLINSIIAHKHMILECYSTKSHKVAAVFVILIIFIIIIFNC